MDAADRWSSSHFLAFLAFRIIPGDPTAKLLGEQATPERVEALRQELGLDRPFLERYVNWLGDFVRGDMGSSYNYSMPVSQMLQGKIPVTGLLTLLSFLLIVVLVHPARDSSPPATAAGRWIRP